ncbi:MAG: hypothetical protein GX804_04240, partial [Lentisphaerae bacterium]|nr:hypothetical protein [Lentisphaerota bacterium]
MATFTTILRSRLIVILSLSLFCAVFSCGTEQAGAYMAEMIADDIRMAWLSDPPAPVDEIHTEYHELEVIPDDFPMVFRVRMCDSDGAVEFLEEPDGTIFFTVQGFHGTGTAAFNPWLAADLHGAPREPMWLPSSVERVYFPATAKTPAIFPEPCAHAGALPSSLRFTSISVLSNAVALGIGWSDANPPPGSELDLFGTTNLSHPTWSWMTRFAVDTTTNETVFPLSPATVFPEALSLMDAMLHPPSPIFTGWNVHTNPPIPEGMEQFFPQEYVPGAVVSNAIYSGNSGTSAFFRLGTLLDSDGD